MLKMTAFRLNWVSVTVLPQMMFRVHGSTASGVPLREHSVRMRVSAIGLCLNHYGPYDLLRHLLVLSKELLPRCVAETVSALIVHMCLNLGISRHPRCRDVTFRHSQVVSIQMLVI